MSLHQLTTSSTPTAHWTCPVCHLTTVPTAGSFAVQEAGLLAGIHDRVHHRGALTAQVLIADELPPVLATAS